MPSLKVLTEELKKEIESGRIQISMQQRGLVVSFSRPRCFLPAKMSISPDAYRRSGKGGRGDHARFPIRCAWKATPIRCPSARPFPQQLGALGGAQHRPAGDSLRRVSACREERMSIAGYADTAPIASNETEGAGPATAAWTSSS